MLSNDCVFLVSSQLTALAMLLLDPYYRTTEGFEVYLQFRCTLLCSLHKSLVSFLQLLLMFFSSQVLIEKEWTSFGHKFQQVKVNKQSTKEFREKPQAAN